MVIKNLQAIFVKDLYDGDELYSVQVLFHKVSFEKIKTNEMELWYVHYPLRIATVTSLPTIVNGQLAYTPMNLFGF